MQVSEMDQTLFAYIKHLMFAMRSKGSRMTRDSHYIRQTKLLWVGKHYLLVRTGPKSEDESQIRKVRLWSREWLLLHRGNPGGHDMMAVALAAIDPAHRNWTENRFRTLHSTGPTNGHARFRGRRFSEKLLREIIAFCEEEDRTLPERFRAVSEKFETENVFSKKTVEAVLAHGFEVEGPREQNGVQYPPGHCYRTRLGYYNSHAPIERIDFTPDKDGEVEVKLNPTSMTPEEFEIFLGAMAQINKLKQRRHEFYREEEEEEDEETT